MNNVLCIAISFKLKSNKWLLITEGETWPTKLGSICFRYIAYDVISWNEFQTLQCMFSYVCLDARITFRTTFQLLVNLNDDMLTVPLNLINSREFTTRHFYYLLYFKTIHCKNYLLMNKCITRLKIATYCI